MTMGRSYGPGHRGVPGGTGQVEMGSLRSLCPLWFKFVARMKRSGTRDFAPGNENSLNRKGRKAAQGVNGDFPNVAILRDLFG